MDKPSSNLNQLFFTKLYSRIWHEREVLSAGLTTAADLRLLVVASVPAYLETMLALKGEADPVPLSVGNGERRSGDHRVVAVKFGDEAAVARHREAEEGALAAAELRTNFKKT